MQQLMLLKKYIFPQNFIYLAIHESYKKIKRISQKRLPLRNFFLI